MINTTNDYRLRQVDLDSSARDSWVVALNTGGGPVNDLDVSRLGTGMYFLWVQQPDGTTKTPSFLKQ